MRVSSGSGPSSPSLTSWSIAARKAAKVLPDPVGAATNTCCPASSAGHARSCAGVGASKVRENHAATAGWNECSGSIWIALFCLDDLLQIIQAALVDAVDRVDRGLVVFFITGVFTGILALEPA